MSAAGSKERSYQSACWDQASLCISYNLSAFLLATQRQSRFSRLGTFGIGSGAGGGGTREEETATLAGVAPPQEYAYSALSIHTEGNIMLQFVVLNYGPYARERLLSGALVRKLYRTKA